MKKIAQSVLVLLVISLTTVSGCGPAPSAGDDPPNADNLVQFDAQGVAVLRGDIAGASIAAGKNEILFVNVPAQMDGMDITIKVPFTVLLDTVIASSTVKQTDMQDYRVFQKGTSAHHAFPSAALVEVTFRKGAGVFEAISILEVTKKFRLFASEPKIMPVFTMHNRTEGTLVGSTTQALKDTDGSVLTWWVVAPIPVHEIESSVIFAFEPAADILSIDRNGNRISTAEVWGDVQVDFTRSGDTLTAEEIRELP